MTNIVEIKTRPAEVRQSVIDVLEAALSEARSGQLIAVAIAGVDRAHSMMHRWSDNDHANLLVGAMARCSHRLNLLLDEDTIVEQPK